MLENRALSAAFVAAWRLSTATALLYYKLENLS
jgi:hypothetical protein